MSAAISNISGTTSFTTLKGAIVLGDMYQMKAADTDYRGNWRVDMRPCRATESAC